MSVQTRFPSWLLSPILVLACGACARVHSSPATDFVAIDAPVVALTRARVIDGTGAPARTDQTIIIKGGTIEAVGDTTAVAVPTGARVVDLSGRTIVPGYVMMHEHLFSTPDGKGYTNTPLSFAPLYLAGGATTIRTGGASSWTDDVSVRDAIEKGEIAGPNIDLTSPYLNKPRLLRFEFGSGAERGRGLVAKWAERVAKNRVSPHVEHMIKRNVAGRKNRPRPGR